jgi:ribosomal protein L1
MKASRRFRSAAQMVDRSKTYTIDEAVEQAKKLKAA